MIPLNKTVQARHAQRSFLRNCRGFLIICTLGLSSVGCQLFSSPQPPAANETALASTAVARATRTAPGAGASNVPSARPQSSTTMADQTESPAALSRPGPSPAPGSPITSSAPAPVPVPSGAPSAPAPVPSAPVCSAPPDWVAYVVRADDTLAALATRANTTVEMLRTANCLTNDALVAGQTLYLPPSNPSQEATTTTPGGSASPDPAVSPLACSVFSCHNGDLPLLVLAPGGPNEASFWPCESPLDEPWLDTRQPLDMELGQRRYFFTCDFATPPISATMRLSNGSVEPVSLISGLPNPDLPIGNAQFAIEWVAMPTDPTGEYILTVADGAGVQAQLAFNVKLPSQPYILPVPLTGARGSTFDIYYVNFGLHTTPTFLLFGEDQPSVGGKHTLSYRTQWQISIDQPLSGMSGRGWAKASLSSHPSDKPAAYSITLDGRGVYSLFWLH